MEKFNLISVILIILSTTDLSSGDEGGQSTEMTGSEFSSGIRSCCQHRFTAEQQRTLCENHLSGTIEINPRLRVYHTFKNVINDSKSIVLSDSEDIPDEFRILINKTTEMKVKVEQWKPMYSDKIAEECIRISKLTRTITLNPENFGSFIVRLAFPMLDQDISTFINFLKTDSDKKLDYFFRFEPFYIQTSIIGNQTLQQNFIDSYAKITENEIQTSEFNTFMTIFNEEFRRIQKICSISSLVQMFKTFKPDVAKYITLMNEDKKKERLEHLGALLPKLENEIGKLCKIDPQLTAVSQEMSV